jgi:hypothetical protein
MVKVGYFCMWQRMMWNNVDNLSHIFCQQVQLWKLYNLVKKYFFTHNVCTKYFQSANITCDEPMKRACNRIINRILLTYKHTYQFLPTYLPNGWIKLKLIYNIFDGIYDYKPNHGCSHICHGVVKHYKHVYLNKIGLSRKNIVLSL